MTSLVRLYPRDWRDRYEDEFLSLLAERPPDARDRVDIVRGAIDARIRPQVRSGSIEPGPEAPSASVSSRVIGVLTLFGAVLWFAALVIFLNGPIVVDSGGSYRDGAAALPIGMLAFVLLGAGLIQVARSLPHGSDAGGLAAAGAAVVGAVWAMMPWVLLLFIVASVGYVALAVSGRRAGVLGTGDAALIVGGQALAWCFLVLALVGIGYSVTPDFDPTYLFFWIANSSIWIAVGHALIVGHRSAVTVGSAASD